MLPVKIRKIIKRFAQPKYLFRMVLLVGIIAACWLVRLHYGMSKNSQEPIITNSTDHPDESKQNAQKYVWRGTGDEPMRLTIASIGIDTYIQKVGVDQHKQVAVPSNIHLVGWFASSVKPGQKGLSIIDGHITGKTMSGVFEKLSQLKPDDRVEVTLGNGKKLKYQVIGKKQVAENKSAQELFSQDLMVKSQLNLITCAGAYDNKLGRYPNRVIVSAKLL